MSTPISTEVGRQADSHKQVRAHVTCTLFTGSAHVVAAHLSSVARYTYGGEKLLKFLSIEPIGVVDSLCIELTSGITHVPPLRAE